MLLDGVFNIDSVKIYPRYIDKALGFPVDFTISIWNEGKWKTVVQRTGYTTPAEPTGEVFNFDATPGSRIRITTTKMSTDANGAYYVQLSEIEATGAFLKELKPVAVDTSATGSSLGKEAELDVANDLALYMPATASTDLAMYQAGADKLTDGDIWTHYSSDEGLTQPGVEEWVEVNLLDNYAINKVVLYSREYGWGFPKDFTISVYYNNE